MLKQMADEQKIGVGVEEAGDTVFELFVSEFGTWTLLITGTNGPSCIAASGKSWMTIPLLRGKTL